MSSAAAVWHLQIIPSSPDPSEDVNACDLRLRRWELWDGGVWDACKKIWREKPRSQIRPTVVTSGLNQKAWCGVLKDVFIISVKLGLRQPSSPKTLLGKQQGYSSICWWWCHIRYRISCIPTKYHCTGLLGKSILFNNPAQNPGYVWFLPYFFVLLQ